MKIKKLLLPCIFAFGTLISVYSQEEKTKISFPITVQPYIQAGTVITMNTASPQISAPTPVNFSGGGGAIINFTPLISLEPRLDFWAMYYLYDGKDAHPAEIEQRTASVLCFMLDVPVGFNFRAGPHTFTPGAGIGFLFRFSFLSSGVKPDEWGATGSAKGDADKIAEWMWDSARFLYPEIFFSWDYEISEHFRAGLTARVYLPVGSLISGNNVDGMIFNISSRFVF